MSINAWISNAEKAMMANMKSVVRLPLPSTRMNKENMYSGIVRMRILTKKLKTAAVKKALLHARKTSASGLPSVIEMRLGVLLSLSAIWNQLSSYPMGLRSRRHLRTSAKWRCTCAGIRPRNYDVCRRSAAPMQLNCVYKRV